MPTSYSEVFYRILIDDYSAPSGCSGTEAVFGTPAEIDEFLTRHRQIEKERCLKRIEFLEPRLASILKALEEAKAAGDMKNIENNRRNLERDISDYDRESKRYFYDNDTYFGTWKKFCQGQTDICFHSYYVSKPRFVESCRILDERELMLDSDFRRVKNIYMYDYMIEWLKAKFKVKWVSFENNSLKHEYSDESVIIDSEEHPNLRKITHSIPTRTTSYARCVMYDLLNPEVNELLDSMDDEREFWGMPGLLEYNKDEGWLRSRMYLTDKTFETLEELEEDIIQFEQPDLRPLLLAVIGDG